MVKFITYVGIGVYGTLVYTGHADMAAHFAMASQAVAEFIPTIVEVTSSWL